MAENVAREEAAPSVVPLRMQTSDGSLYYRRKEVEADLALLSHLPSKELVERSRIEDTKDPNHVPSECILYFVRRPHFGEDSEAFRDLFIILRQRVLRATPTSSRQLPGSSKRGVNSVDLEIQEGVLQKFQELLCIDRSTYDTRLDFYECQFNSALAALRATVRKEVRKEHSHRESLEDEAASNEPSREVNTALATLKNSEDDNLDFLYRSKLHVAISSLPPEERRVVELWLKDVPIDSQDENLLTMVKVLGCAEKTVRNRRDRAFQRLHDALREEDDA